MAKLDEIPQFIAHNREEWRDFLAECHDQLDGVWLVTNKKSSGRSHLSYDEAVEEALCFGWIDSIPRKLDEVQSMLLCTPRKPKSNWSALNKRRVASLIEQGLIMPAGLKMIEIAKESGTWDALNDVENLIVPIDLQTALDQNNMARTNFEILSRSTKRGVLEWLLSAKRPETRQARISQIIARTAAKQKIL